MDANWEAGRVLALCLPQPSQIGKSAWAKDGDCNSSLFHRVASGQKSRNRIGPLVSDLGEVIKEVKKIKEEVISFFSKLYGPKS